MTANLSVCFFPRGAGILAGVRGKKGVVVLTIVLVGLLVLKNDPGWTSTQIEPRDAWEGWTPAPTTLTLAESQAGLLSEALAAGLYPTEAIEAGLRRSQGMGLREVARLQSVHRFVVIRPSFVISPKQ
jgi:hypothetical protein